MTERHLSNALLAAVILLLVLIADVIALFERRAG